MSETNASWRGRAPAAGPPASREALARDFIAGYGRYFGRWRLERIRAGGRFLVERDGDGAWVIDAAGNRYLDFFLASGVFTLGHKNPAVGAALREALVAEDFGGVFYFSEAKGELAKRLVETTPAGLDVVLPAVGGGEAMDLAMKLCMAATGRREFICAEDSYHGSTGLAFALGPAMLREWVPFEGVRVHRVPPGDAEALRAVFSDRIAGCVFEPVRSLTDGRRPTPEYWATVRALCDRYGAKLVADEVVCGMGRLGALWGASLDTMAPDLLVTAKGLSGGYFPLAAVVMRESMLDVWGDWPLRAFSTYAWSTAGARAGVAAIAETERLLPGALAAGDRLEAALRALAAQYPEHIREVRRTGMHFVLALNEARMGGARLNNALFERGVLVHASGAYPNAPCKLMPPLCLDDSHIGEFATRAEDALRAVG